MKHRLSIISPKNLTTTKRLVGALIVLISMAFTYLLWGSLHASNQTIAIQRFERDADALVDIVQLRLEVYADALYSGRALFLMNPSLTREQWDVYMQSHNLARRYPGINNVGYVKTGTAAQAADIERFINESLPRGVTPVSIYPRPLTDQLAVVSYLSQPGSGQSLGLNVITRPHFAEVIERAATTGVPAASTPYDSRNEERVGTQDVTIVMAVYDGTFRETMSDNEKRAAVTGYIFASIHPKTIFKYALARLTTHEDIGIKAVDHDGRTVYQIDTQSSDTEQIARTVELVVGGRTWVVTATTPSTYQLTPREQLAPYIFLVGGTLFMVMLVSLYFYKQGVRIKRIPRE